MTAPDTETLAGLRRDNERWQTNSRETWQAMSAMRDSINEYIPMPSAESDLLQGPDNSVFCDTIARSVIAETIALRAQAATNKARIERLEAALRPFSIMAGEMFARNWNKDGVAISFVGKDGPIRLTFTDFLAARAALEDGE